MRPATTRALGCWQIAMWANASGDYPVTWYAYDNGGQRRAREDDNDSRRYHRLR